MIKCYICRTDCSKYKCPICVIPYCSVKCFQTHKESNTCREMTSSVSDNNTTTQPAESEQMEVLESYQFPTKHTVPQDKLALLGKNENLRILLANSHLRTILTALTKTQNIHHAMNMVMLEPIFVEFAMECLKTVEGEEIEEGEENVEMKQFVKQIKQLAELSGG